MSGQQNIPGWVLGSLGVLGALVTISTLGTPAWDTHPERTAAPVLTSRPFKVALVTPGPIDDAGWSQSAHDGLRLIRSELGARVAYRASVAPRDAEGVIRQFAADGYSFIIVHGAQYIPAAEAVAEDYFRTKFAVTTSYPGNNKNFGGLAFRAGEVGYLAGVVAAMTTRSKQVAYLGGEIYPITEEDTLLFRRGVRAIAPDVKVNVEWVRSWTDTTKARALAEAQLKQGADVLAINASLASTGALEAVENAGASAIGWDQSAERRAPRAVVTSVIQRVPQLFLEGARLVRQGRWEGRQYKFGLREGAQTLSPLQGRLTPMQARRVEAIAEDIQRGKIDVSP